MKPVSEHTIPARTHGRYLVSAGSTARAPMLIGFHGYGETAEEALDRSRAIPGAQDWTVVSIQGLHQLYRRKTNDVVASWMTRQNRELSIEDNIAYVSSIVERLTQEPPAALIFAGFSQGVAMAFRAAATVRGLVSGVIGCGGDVPPELDTAALQRIPAALLGRGTRDEWYTSEKLTRDEQRLRAAEVRIQSLILDAGHEWTPVFSEACGRFLLNLKS